MTVEVSSNGVDYTRGGMEVWYHGEARLMAVRPSTGPEGGGTEVTLVGDGMVRGGVHSRCRFGAGEDREGRARWETSTAVACTTPGSGGLVGNVTVELVGEEGRASGSNGVRYEYRREGGIAVGDGRAGRPEVRVDGMRPSFGRVTGGTMVTLTGRGLMWEGMGVFGCRFGSAASVAAHSTSSSMVQCVTPEAVEGGKVSMVLEEDGERVWEGGEAYAYEAAASVHGIRPMFGSAMEGHNVTVMGRHFSNTGALTCRVGMGRQAVARWLSSTSVVCVLPAAEGRTGGTQNVTVDVSNNGADFSEGGGARFRYVAGSATVASMTPSWGPSGRGTAVTVVGAGLEEAEEGLVMCRVGSMTASCAGRTEGRGVVCVLPGQRAQQVEVEVSRDGGETYGAAGRVFEYVTDGVVVRMVPSEGPVEGGTRVRVVGEHLREGGETGCVFGRGGTYVAGRWESSSVVQCTSPMMTEEGVVRVLAVSDGVEMSGEDEGGRFVYKEWPSVESVEPEEGHAGEETVVRVGMAGGAPLEVGGRVECRVGGRERLEGRVTTGRSVECKLPGRSQGNVTVEVSLNGEDWVGGGVQFRYRGICVTGAVVPSMGTEEGGTTVTVQGRGFKEGSTGGGRCVVSVWGGGGGGGRCGVGRGGEVRGTGERRS